jgi:hypothetical protein
MGDGFRLLVHGKEKGGGIKENSGGRQAVKAIEKVLS